MARKAKGPARVEPMGKGWCIFMGVMPCGGWTTKKDAQGQADLMNRALQIWVNTTEGQLWLAQAEVSL